MSAEDDIDRFIELQKKKLARERKDLQNANSNQLTDPPRNGIYPNGDIALKENLPIKAVPDDTGIPIGPNQTVRDKLQKERQEEYNKFIEEKKSRSSMKRSTLEGDGLSLPIGERSSAQERARIQRNKEYNEFLKQQGGQKRRSQESSLEKSPPAGGFPTANGGIQTNGHGPNAHRNSSYDAPRAHREASSQTPVPRVYDDLPPRGPRKGWGTPQPLDYEDILRKKREEEMRYRRDDFDYYNQPRLKPAHSDSYLNRYEDDGRRSSRRDYLEDYDKRRVRFSDEVVPSGPPVAHGGPEYPDRFYRPRPRNEVEEPIQYDWSQSRTGRSRTLTDIERSKPALKVEEPDRPPRAKSATFTEDVGLPLGQRDTNSATRRKKEQYRKELEQQMKEAKAAKIREKEIDRSPGFPGSKQPAPAQSVSGRQSRNQVQAAPTGGQGQGRGQQGVPQGYTPSFANQPQPVRVQSSSGQYGPQSQTPSFGVGATPLSQVPPPQPLGDLGLKEAMAKSQPDLLDRPFSLNYPQPSQLQQPGVNSTDPYMYYGMRNPLDADPHPGMVPGLPHPTAVSATTMVPPSSALTSPLMERYFLLQQQQQQLLQQQQQIFQQTKQLEQLPTDPRRLDRVLNQPSVTKQTAAHLRGESAIKNFVGDSQLSPRSQLPGTSYREQLVLQMREKEAKKLVENAEKAAYDAKKENEIKVYDPWGKGGAGAPMRDKQGKIVADLKKLHDRNESLLMDPRRQDLQLYSNTASGVPAPAGGLPAGQEVSPLLAAAAATSAGPEAGSVGVAGAGPTYGKMRGAITGGPADPGADASRNEYQEALRIQVEEKKRREAEEKEKIRLEEEREEKRLAAQRERIKKDYEIEMERKKQKEEAQRKQKEELERQLEEKRKEADTKRKEANEQKRKEAEEQLRHRDLNHNVNQLNQRVESPPIPTMRPKPKETERGVSPPVPTLRKADTGGEKNSNSDEQSRRMTSSPPIPSHQNKDKKSKRSESRVESKVESQYLVDWLREIDPDLVVYAAPLSENGYKTWNTIRRLKRSTLLELCPDIKHGHIEAILHEVNRAQTPRSKDDDYRTVSGASSPPVPAVTTKERGGPKDDEHVMGALSAMRMQLAHEQQRIQSQLDKHRDYDPYNPLPKAAPAPRRGSPQVDVFELARHKGSVAVLRNTTHQAAEDFDGLKNRSGSRSRQQLKDAFPNKPESDISLEAQQRALLRAQQEKLEEMRKGKKTTAADIPSLRDLGRGSPAIPLDSDSAFIGVDSGETRMPKTPTLQTRSSAVPSPVNSQPKTSGRSVSVLNNDDLDMIIAKSKARSDAIETLHDNNDDPDDILNKFLAKKSYDSRPPSGKSEDLSLWLKP